MAFLIVFCCKAKDKFELHFHFHFALLNLFFKRFGGSNKKILSHKLQLLLQCCDNISGQYLYQRYFWVLNILTKYIKW